MKAFKKILQAPKITQKQKVRLEVDQTNKAIIPSP